jgi:hypothetical protein
VAIIIYKTTTTITKNEGKQEQNLRTQRDQTTSLSLTRESRLPSPVGHDSGGDVAVARWCFGGGVLPSSFSLFCLLFSLILDGDFVVMIEWWLCCKDDEG